MVSGPLRAMQEASQLLVHLDIDTSRPVDPFKAIDDLQLELRFEPMKELLGVIIPADPPHVIINNRMPASVQRFTAAHEIGHWILDREQLTLDRDVDIQGLPNAARERNAQIFAGYFLMPLPLLYEVAAEHGVVKGGSISPAQVYAMARDMHVSYTATAHHLANTHFISGSRRGEYLNVTPASLKKALTRGMSLANSRGDVWPVEVRQDSVEVQVFAGDEIVVSLPEAPGTGYTWMPLETGWTFHATGKGEFRELSEFVASAPAGPEATGDGDVVETSPPLAVVSDVFEGPATQNGIIGGLGHRMVGLAATVAGEWTVDMRHMRPFADDVLESVELRAIVRPLPQAETKLRWIRAFRDEDAGLAHIERDDPK